MARFSFGFAVVAMLLSPLAVMGAEGEPAVQGGLSKAFQNAKPDGANTYSVAGNASGKKPKSIEQMLKELGDNDVLVRIEGVCELKWGLLRRHVEALCSDIDRPDMQSEGNEAIRSVAFQSRLRKLLKEYVEHAVFAAEARRIGITVAPETFEEYREKARTGYAKMGKAGQALLGLMNEGECFYENNLTNALYWQAYKVRVLNPMTEADDDEVVRMAEMVRSANSASVATNRFNRAFMSEILSKLKDGMEFGDAAEKWSDCDSSVTRGVMMDAVEEHPERFASGDLPEEIEAAIAGLKEGETSGVIESPVAWHIVRLLKRNLPPEHAEQTVEIAQIMIEKNMLQPELTSAQARAKVEAIKMKAVLKARFRELYDTVKIDCKIPLWEPADPSKRAVKIRRIK